MNRYSIGLFASAIFFLINFSQLHVLIPGIKYLKLGLLTSIILSISIFPDIFKKEWYTPLGKWRLLFILSLVPGMFFGFSTGYPRTAVIISLQDFIAGFIAPCIFIRGVKELKTFNKIIILTTLFISIYVIMNHGHGPGVLVDENDVGLVLVMLLPFTYLSMNMSNKRTFKIGCLLLFFLSLLAIASTISRGAMVGTLPTLIAIWLNSRRKLLTVFSMLLVLVICVFLAPPNLMHEFESIKNVDQGTAHSRRYFWQLSMEMFNQRPIFGVGAMSWGSALWSGKLHLHLIESVPISTPHSLYFQILSELGLVGAICWLLLMFKTFQVGTKIKKAAYINFPDGDEEIDFILLFMKCIIIGLIGGLISGLFLSFMMYPHLYAFIALMQVVLILVQKKINEKSEIPQNNET